MSSIADSDAADRADTMIRVVIGPTAAGKSRIALALAEARSLGIVSADSRQVYRAFDIGTAKPSAAERARVPHAGIDVLDPMPRYSAHAWAAHADGWCEDFVATGRHPVVVGGTGFYIRALVSPLDVVPALDTAARTELGRWLEQLDAATLARWVARLDPDRLRYGRTQHLRAVETALLSGTRLGDALRAPSASARPVRYLVVDPGAPLAERIARRVHAMVANGWLDEVERLVSTVPDDAPAWNASGYETFRHCVTGHLQQRDAVERVIIETRQYAKRQRTWCRHQLPAECVTQLNPDQGDAIERAIDWWDSGSGATE